MDCVSQSEVIGWGGSAWANLTDIWSPIVESDPKQFLEIGANRGGLSLWAALRGHNVICSDYPNVRTSAVELHKRHNVKIDYRTVDATEIPFRGLDVVASKSVLVSLSRTGGIENMNRAVASIHEALAPGGYFLFAENMAGTRIHRLARRQLTRWASGLVYPTDEQWSDLLSVFDHVERHNFGFLHSFGFAPRLRRALGAFDLKFNDRLPDDWKTVTIGVARKAA